MRTVVFLDVADETKLDNVKKYINVDADQIIDASGGFISCWYENAEQFKSDTFTCYITERKVLDDGDVIFSLFTARIPTLTMASCETISPLQMTGSDESTIEQFLYKADTPGKVFVIEGGDGAGKATQTGMLVDKLKKENYSVHTLDFPYEKGLFGALIRIVLSGKKGGIGDLDPALFSFLYSLNRYGCLPELSLWMRRGSVTVLDRFYTANFGHQASKLPEDQRKDFINRLEHLEVDWLGLPQADLVFYLDLPPKAALEAMKQDHTRKYLDIHETAGNNYKENVRLTYVWCCENLKGWNHILCCNSDGERFERSHISSLIHERVARTI